MRSVAGQTIFFYIKNDRVKKYETLVIVLIDNLNNMNKQITINKLINFFKKKNLAHLGYQTTQS